MPERRPGILAACVAGLALLLLTLPGAARGEDLLDVVRARGHIVIGVKSDYPLFGEVGPGGQLVGLEVEVANAIAERLGLRAEVVAVTSANRLQRLEDGTVDMVIATLGDTEQRRAIATLLEPNYYASGVNLMAPPGSLIRDWSDLRGRPVCATQGAYFNRLIAERYLVDLQIFGNNRDARLAVRAGRCVGWIYDDTAIAADLLSPEWAGWRMPLTSALVTPWAIALPRSAASSALRRAVEDIVGDWHRTGFLLDLEKLSGIPQSAFLLRTHELWRTTDERGEFVCRRGANGAWPEECRNRALLSSTDVTGLMRLGLLIKERFGVDLAIVYDPYDRTSFGLGLLRTLLLVVGSMAGAVLFGAGAALVVGRRIPVLTQLVRSALTILRLTPPLLQVYVVFFGIGTWLAGSWGVVVNPLLVALLCLSAYAGAAVGQVLLDAALVIARRDGEERRGLRAVGAAALAGRDAIFGILVNIAKATGLASVIAAPEVISAATAIMAERGNVTVMMNVLLIVYVAIVLGTVMLLGALLRRLDALLGRGPRAVA